MVSTCVEFCIHTYIHTFMHVTFKCLMTTHSEVTLTAVLEITKNKVYIIYKILCSSVLVTECGKSIPETKCHKMMPKHLSFSFLSVVH